MTTQEVNLLPDEIRDRTERAVRSGRYGVAVAIAAAVVALLVAHARMGLAAAREETDEVRTRAALVFAEEQRIAAVEAEIARLAASRSRYREIALPIEIGRLIATIAEIMPPGVTLERLDLDARPSDLRRGRGPEPAGGDGARRLRGELSGFAPDDRAIASLVGELAGRAPFDGVSLDFSRSRQVRERPARAFRLSFVVDLDVRYEVTAVGPTSEADAIAEADAGYDGEGGAR